MECIKLNQDMLSEIEKEINKMNISELEQVLIKKIEAWDGETIWDEIYNISDLRSAEEKVRYYFKRILAINKEMLNKNQEFKRGVEEIIKQSEYYLDTKYIDSDINQKECIVQLFYQSLREKYKEQKSKNILLGFTGQSPRILNEPILDKSDLNIKRGVDYFIRYVAAKDLLNDLFCLISQIVCSNDIAKIE